MRFLRMLCEVRGDRQVNPMTIVELFDEKPINNIVGALCFHLLKMIFLKNMKKC